MIECDYGTENYDGFLILNADNVVTENYLEKMNDAFVACGKKCVITSYRNSKNFGENAMSCLYGFFFVAACRLESAGERYAAAPRECRARDISCPLPR